MTRDELREMYDNSCKNNIDKIDESFPDQNINYIEWLEDRLLEKVNYKNKCKECHYYDDVHIPYDIHEHPITIEPTCFYFYANLNKDIKRIKR